MKTIIITSALILGSLLQVAAQQNRPGQPIGGIVVKGGKTESAEAKVAGNPIGGIIVKGKTEEGAPAKGVNPLFEADSKSQLKTTGGPIGGIVVKGGKSASVPTFSRVTDSKGTFELTIPESGSYTFFVGPIKGLIIKLHRADVQQIITYPVNDNGSVILADLRAGTYQFTAVAAEQSTVNNPLYTPSANEHVNPLYQN